MVQVLSNVSDSILYTIVSGKLTVGDYDKFLPIAKEKIAHFGKVKWYFEMKDFEGWEADALWKDIKFDIKHFNDVEKMAIVGEKKLHEIVTQFTKPFTGATVKYFDSTDKEEAKDWIKR